MSIILKTGFIFLLLPHFEECDKFYMCAHGKEVEFSCGPGTIFDFELQGCDWSWATTCQLRDPKDIEGSGEEELEWAADADEAHIGVLDILSAASDVRPAPVESGHIFGSILNCNSAESAARHVAYRGDCQRYWRCDNGIPQAAFCSDGLYFNERTQQCDFEANSKCVDNQPNELGGEFIEYK
ncbi:hypothetical protein MSG28_015180 [Choristoneura fumiferana]|uniref:Uncharacterized protein n=1 Tax=Choristoneura fumiferana TaxID=7141 RepID=A0ACC0KZ60_CHOFU|nr:hypothetical protein MSG28_015180 [Choristoneura fumiferana]